MVDIIKRQFNTIENVRQVIITANGFRLEVLPVENKVYETVYQYWTPGSAGEPTDKLVRVYGFQSPALAHNLELNDRSEVYPNPHTEKQLQKVRELVLSHTAVVRGVSFTIYGMNGEIIRQRGNPVSVG